MINKVKSEFRPSLSLFSLLAFRAVKELGSKTVVLKLWVATQIWVAEGQKLGRAKVIQICQNDFLQDKNLQDKTTFFHSVTWRVLDLS